METSSAGMHCGLCGVCESIASSSSVEALLDNLAGAAASVLGADGALVRLLDEKRETLKLASVAGMSGQAVGAGELELARSPVDKAAIGGAVVEIRDVAAEDGLPAGGGTPAGGVGSALAAPLCLADRCVGVMHVYRREVRPFSDEEKAMARTLAAHAGIVLERLRLFRQTRVLGEIAAAINSSLEESAVLSAIVRQAAEVLGFKGASIRMLDDDGRRLVLRAAHGLSDEYKGKGPVELEKSPLDREVLSGKVVSLSDGEVGGRLQYPEETRREGIKAVLCLPLAVKGRPVGVLRVYSSVPYRFVDSDVDFLKSLADHGAIAVENARLFEHLRRDYADLTREVWKWYDWGERPPKL